LPHVQYDIPGKTTSERLLHERLAREGRQRRIQYHVQSPVTVAVVVASSNLIATLPERFALRCRERHALGIFAMPLDLPVVQNRLYWHECMHCDLRNRWFRGLFEDLAGETRSSAPAQSRAPASKLDPMQHARVPLRT
jgi:DNA-binding transcriptional LysR family regulator